VGPLVLRGAVVDSLAFAAGVRSMASTGGAQLLRAGNGGLKGNTISKREL